MVFGETTRMAILSNIKHLIVLAIMIHDQVFLGVQFIIIVPRWGQIKEDWSCVILENILLWPISHLLSHLIQHH